MSSKYKWKFDEDDEIRKDSQDEVQKLIQELSKKTFFGASIDIPASSSLFSASSPSSSPYNYGKRSESAAAADDDVIEEAQSILRGWMSKPKHDDEDIFQKDPRHISAAEWMRVHQNENGSSSSSSSAASKASTASRKKRSDSASTSLGINPPPLLDPRKAMEERQRHLLEMRNDRILKRLQQEQQIEAEQAAAADSKKREKRRGEKDGDRPKEKPLIVMSPLDEIEKENMDRIKLQIASELEQLKMIQDRKIQSKKELEDHVSLQRELLRVQAETEREKQAEIMERRLLFRSQFHKYVLTQAKMLKRKYFKTWIGFLLSRRTIHQRALSFQSTRMKNHAFQEWRRFALRSRAEREAFAYAQEVQRIQLLNTKAVNHCRHSLLRSSFNTWLSFVHQSREQKQKEMEHAQRQHRIAMLSALAIRQKEEKERAEERSRQQAQLQAQYLQQLHLEKELEAMIDAGSSSSPRDIPATAAAQHAPLAPSSAIKQHTVPEAAFDPIVDTMMARAIERRERRKTLQAKYEQLEQEKQLKLKEEEEKRLAQIELEKKMKLEEKRRQRQQAIELEQQRMVLAQKIRQADDHYLKSVMRRFGWIPLRRLVMFAHNQSDNADRYWIQCTLRSHWTQWVTMVAKARHDRAFAAAAKIAALSRVCNTLLLHHCLRKWTNVVADADEEKALADRVRSRSLVATAWKTWVTKFVSCSAARAEVDRAKEAKADNLYSITLLRQCFQLLKDNVRTARLDKEKESIRSHLRAVALSMRAKS